MRQIIYLAVANHHDHPTAEELYEQLKPQYPSLSLGTVYRNLGILEEQSLIRKIVTSGSADRFDGRVRPHPHIRCKTCGRIDDVFLPYDPRLDDDARRRTGYLVEQHDIMFYGICKVCKEKMIAAKEE